MSDSGYHVDRLQAEIQEIAEVVSVSLMTVKRVLDVDQIKAAKSSRHG